MKRPQCTDRGPRRKTDGTGNRTRQCPGAHTKTTAAHAARDRRRRDPPRTTPSWGPERVRRGASPAPLPRQGRAAGTESPVLERPRSAPRSRPVNPGAKALGVGKSTTVSEKPTGAPTATGPDRARRTTRGHEARQGGTSPATTKAHGQVPSNNGHRLPPTRTARTTRNQPRHANTRQATEVPSRWTCAHPAANPAPAGYETAAVRMDMCTPGSVPSPCRLRTSRRQDGRVRARRVPSPCRLRIAAIRMGECAHRSNAPHSQVAQDTAHVTQHTERAHQ